MNTPQQDHQQIHVDYNDQQPVKKKKKIKKNKDAGLSWSIYRLFKLMFPMRADWKALLPFPLFIFAIGMGVIFAWMYNKYTTLAGDIVNSVYADDRDKFWDCIRRMALYIVTGSMMQAIVMAIGDVLCGMIWRKSICSYFDKRYTRHKNFFKILNLDDRIKDTDQRIVADTNLFLRKFKTIIFGEPNFTGILINCCSITWFTVTLSERGAWFLPLVVWSYFIAGMFISRIVMIPATISTKKQAKLKGEYQFAHSYFRVNTENIAMWEGQDFEYIKLKKYMIKAVKHYGYVVVFQFPINYFGLAWQWGCQLACYVFPAVAWWDLKISGCTGVDNYFVVTQVSYNLLWTFSLCLLLAQESTELFGVTKRLGELIKVLDELEEQPAEPPHVHFGEMIEYKGVTCANPSGEALIVDVSFEVQPDNSVLIMGPSGIGKSSLLRILSGVWPCPTGSVVRPKRIGRGGIVFMPQKPYLSLGTFKEQITYPYPAEILSDSEMMDLLNKVKLGYLVQRYSEDLNKVRTWVNLLSGGEQQRLSIARLLFHCPKYAVMDEATSAIDENGENDIFSELKLHGITLLSVAHRRTVRRFHKRVVQLQEGGTWYIEDTDSTIDGPPAKYTRGFSPPNSYANFYE